MRALLAAALLAACGGDDPAPVPTANPAREITDTALSLDITAMTGTATVTLAPSDTAGATLEVGDLVLDSVVDPDGAPIAFTPPYVSSLAGARTNTVIDLALPIDGPPVTISYHYKLHENFAGISKNHWSLVWPYFCGDMFPCHSDPADGTTFSSFAVTGVPAGDVAIYPDAIATDVPSYQIAFAAADYVEMPLGTTTAGTNVSMWYRTSKPNEMANAAAGGAHLAAAFDWFEKTLGPYRFGPKVGGIPVPWGAGEIGGMEHHPYFHVADADIGDEETNVHESAHGWYGDGIRIACWEDFLLSEGTVSYLAGRALEVVAPDVGAKVWADYAKELADLDGTEPVWPDSCGAVDVIKDHLFTDAPYMRGAYFYRAVAMKTSPELVDQALHDFYMAHQGGAAHMSEMLDQLHTTTGYDPTTCADMWLRSTTIPAIGPCP